ncbi:MAG: GAF and ANTAR domain-containing protein [Burkholderiaceae bacterium]|nr:GAF and ANTAR domain-containing protein [Microbacteriaceae bacterium]
MDDQFPPEVALADVFVRLADSLREGYDVVDTLDLLVRASVNFTDASSAGILLADDDGVLHIAASSSERARHVEEAQMGASEGPCFECFHSGEIVEVPDIRSVRGRWLQFADIAESYGIQSSHAIPLKLRSTTLGGLGLFSDRPGPMSDRDAAVGLALAQIATISIMQYQTIARSGTVATQLKGALFSRVLIEQAKGVVAQQCAVSIDEAFELLRRHSRQTRTGLRAVADRVVNDGLHISGQPG